MTARLALKVTILAVVMALVQYGLAVGGISPLAALGAGLAGIAGAALMSGFRRGVNASAQVQPALVGALASYGGLSAVMAVIAWPGPLRALLFPAVWQVTFPQVVTQEGFVTAAGPGQSSARSCIRVRRSCWRRSPVMPCSGGRSCALVKT